MYLIGTNKLDLSSLAYSFVQCTLQKAVMVATLKYCLTKSTEIIQSLMYMRIWNSNMWLSHNPYIYVCIFLFFFHFSFSLYLYLVLKTEDTFDTSCCYRKYFSHNHLLTVQESHLFLQITFFTNPKNASSYMLDPLQIPLDKNIAK